MKLLFATIFLVALPLWGSEPRRELRPIEPDGCGSIEGALELLQLRLNHEPELLAAVNRIREDRAIQKIHWERLEARVLQLEEELRKAQEAKVRDDLRIADLENEVKQAAKAALIDRLTGAKRPEWLNEFFMTKGFNIMRPQRALSMIGIDIDDLKKLNSTYGHVAVDGVLKKIGQVMRDYFENEAPIRHADFELIRTGGDEFAAIVKDGVGSEENFDPLRIWDTGEGLRRSIEKADLLSGLTKRPREEVDEGYYYDRQNVTISVGIATARVETGRAYQSFEVENLIKYLRIVNEQAREVSKQQGKNQTIIAVETIPAKADVPDKYNGRLMVFEWLEDDY